MHSGIIINAKWKKLHLNSVRPRCLNVFVLSGMCVCVGGRGGGGGGGGEEEEEEEKKKKHTHSRTHARTHARTYTHTHTNTTSKKHDNVRISKSSML